MLLDIEWQARNPPIDRLTEYRFGSSRGILTNAKNKFAVIDASDMGIQVDTTDTNNRFILSNATSLLPKTYCGTIKEKNSRAMEALTDIRRGNYRMLACIILRY